MQQLEPLRPYVLSIAGFDPSGGAGILADIKTMENIGVIGLGNCSAITIQHESVFQSLSWVAQEEVLAQANVLLGRYSLSAVKVGLIQSLPLLKKLLLLLREKNPSSIVVWDPVLSASSGYTFHKNWKAKDLFEVMELVYCVTPNLKELEKLSQGKTEDFIQKTRQQTNLLVKGGHGIEANVQDVLYTKEEIHSFESPRSAYDKHGTGCVLSSAIASYMAMGHPLPQACQKAKQYTMQFIQSSEGLLGRHLSLAFT